ncbi:MAG: hypothetical protein AAF380_01770 [Bacteroidota bacterium]
MNQIIHAIESLNKFPIFGQHQDSLTSKNVWERVLRLQTVHDIDFEKSVTPDTVLDYKSLFSNRLLTYLYERDFIFLPHEKYTLTRASEYKHFYDLEIDENCAFLKKWLEKYCFGFLEQQIDVHGKWTKKNL